MTEAYIFDLDGVLVDTVELHYKSWQKLADKLGFNLPIDLQNKFRGANRLKSLNLVLAEGALSASPEEKEDYCHWKNEWYLESLENITRDILLPGSLEVLQLISKSGFKIGLASSSKNAKHTINKLQMSDFFDIMLDGNDVVESKPDPTIFLKAACGLQIQPKNCIVFEDSPLGIQAAIDGGFQVIGIGDRQYLTESEYVIKDLSYFKL